MKNRNTSDMPNFTGTIDQLLNHCATLDPEVVERDVEEDKAISMIMDMHDCDSDEARRILEKAQLDMVQEAINQLMNDGKVKIVGYNDNGEPLYSNV
jgi:hypothetical protein